MALTLVEADKIEQCLKADSTLAERPVVNILSIIHFQFHVLLAHHLIWLEGETHAEGKAEEGGEVING